MGPIAIVIWLFLGAGTAVLVIVVLQKERLVKARGNLHRFTEDLTRYIREKRGLQQQVAAVRSEIESLNGSLLQIVQERDVLEVCFAPVEQALQSRPRVDADRSMIFGRGREWVYLYTFPVHEDLARERKLARYPMKLGMSTQDDVVARVDQQVSGTSTAISERAAIRLAFRINDSRHLEKWMHTWLNRNGHRVADSVGVEWFQTSPKEVVQLFRSYVLTHTRASDSVALPPSN